MAALAAGCVACASAQAYEDGAPPAHTGGFGEADCTACHADNDLNDPQGRLRIEGLSPAIVAGEKYRIRIILEHAELESGGFQASIRTVTGRPAGTIELTSDRTTVVESNGQPYVQHSAEGRQSDKQRMIDWSFIWVAPALDQPLVLHVAANASNDDLSALGDYVYTASEEVGERRPTK